MNKYRVIKPLARSTPTNGFETFTVGDLIELDDADAARMIEAEIVEAKPLESPKVLRAEAVETEVMPEANVEKAVKRGRKEK